MTDPTPSQRLREALQEARAVIAYDLPNLHTDPDCDHCQRCRDALITIDAALAAQEVAPQPEVASLKLLVDSAVAVGRREADSWTTAWASLVAGILGHFPLERHGEDVVALLLEMRHKAEAHDAACSQEGA